MFQYDQDKENYARAQVSSEASVRRIHHRFPLTLKMLTLTITIGLAAWAAVDIIQTRHINHFFKEHLDKQLNDQALEDRLRFDHYVKTFHQSVRLFVTLEIFSDYIDDNDWLEHSRDSITYYTRSPAWFPGTSIQRTFAHPRYALLLSHDGKVREVYMRRRGTLPRFLLEPSSLLLAKSRRQGFITTFMGQPFIVTNESYPDSEGNVKAILMIASPIDDELLITALGTFSHGRLVALLTDEEEPRILTSSNIDKLPPGAALKVLEQNHLITGQEFFDYGAAEQAVRFVSFISADEIEAQAQAVISRGRQHIAMTALVFIVTFGVIMFWITQRVQRLTLRISDFSKQSLGSTSQECTSGDQLHILEDRFHVLTEEVLTAREVIRTEAEERLLLEKKNMEIQQKEKQLSLLQSVTQAVGIGVLSKTDNGLESVNKQMARFADICKGLHHFDIEDSEYEERTLPDEQGDNHIFHISRPEIFKEKKIYLIRDITKERLQTAALEHLAMHDSLTGLPNRVLLRDRLQQAIVAGQRDNQKVALLMIDLDRFKEINDTLGHHVGDMLLMEAGSRLPSVLRKSDTIARLGGDEFAVVLPSTERAESKQAAKKLLNILEDPFVIQGHSLYIGASIGIVCFPDHGQDASTLLQHADVAMYLAKNSQRGLAFYNPDRDQHSLRNLVLMGDLRQAIENGELSLNYQPKVSCASRKIIGVEALVRWNHPEHGFIPPDQFIPVAEHTGLIKPLTMWVIDTALQQCSEWKYLIHDLHIRMSVNLSVRNLLDLQFPEEVSDLLIKWDIDSSSLELEITESAVMEDPDHAMKVLMLLDTLGVQLSIDDFGTGYTSLGYLKKLPVDIIKIDKSFVMNMLMDQSDAMIVRSTIDLAHNLGLSVIAEGVESEEILLSLSNMGCDGIQGYYICRPVPADDFSTWFKNSKWGT
ncbi:MAG: EAL domain-containing protein [Nitrospiraceae bacterium]|nr:MAG: EAL domain-containing protein [Nitrospiraceae bacterium]